MMWQDVLLDRWVEAPELGDAVARAFGVPIMCVAVVDEPEELATVSPSARVTLERTRQDRDFPLQLLVILRDDELADRFAGFQGARTVATTLSGRLGASVLFAEGPLAPSEWVRVGPAGAVDLVSLDTDETGHVDAYFVVAERPFTGAHRTSESHVVATTT